MNTIVNSDYLRILELREAIKCAKQDGSFSIDSTVRKALVMSLQAEHDMLIDKANSGLGPIISALERKQKNQ